MEQDYFHYLAELAPDLGEAAEFASKYVDSDPSSSVVKCRIVVEQLALHVADFLGIDVATKPKLIELLGDPEFEAFIPKNIRMKADVVRENGNRGAHGERISSGTSQWILRETHSIVRWFVHTFAGKGVEESRKQDLEDERRARRELVSTLYLSDSSLVVPAAPPDSPLDVESMLNRSGLRELVDSTAFWRARSRSWRVKYSIEYDDETRTTSLADTLTDHPFPE